MTHMTHTGSFIWYDLLTSDVAAAQAFYGALLGWQVSAKPHDGMDYHILRGPSGEGIGGMMPRPEPMAKMGVPPCWQGYITVADIDAAVAAILADGGKSWSRETLAGVGSFALVSDPQGASFYLMAPEGDDEGTAFAPHKPGHCSWHEYHGKDGAAALDFYVKHFGWTRDAPFDMGPMGLYHLFSINGTQAGGIMTDAAMPHPAWLYYFNVADIDAAKATLENAGGIVVMGPREVPGGQQVLVAQDPQGAHFALVTLPR